MSGAPGKLERIWIKRFKGGPMDAVDRAPLIAGQGLQDNADQRLKRQVTILEQEEWDRVSKEAGTDADPSRRRANFLVSNIRLANSRHRILHIGSCAIRIHGETKPCYQMDRISDGLRQIMWADWAGGAYGEVITGGSIAIGDEVFWGSEDETLLPGNRRTTVKANQTQ